MNETNELLKTAINLHYKERPHILNEATRLIEEYNSQKQAHFKYDETLKTLHNLMIDLPEIILLYYLTTVSFPNTEEERRCSLFLDSMKKSRSFLGDSINAVLNDYINDFAPALVTLNTELASSTEAGDSPRNDCKSLLDICAEYVLSNLHNLYEFYNEKSNLAWSKVENEQYVGEDQKMCYNAIKDMNTKKGWLRMISDGYVSGDVLEDQYGKSEIFLKTQQMHIKNQGATSQAEKQLEDAIRFYVTG